MSQDFPNRADWLAIRAKAVRWMHVSKVPQWIQVPALDGIFKPTMKMVWPKGETFSRGRRTEKIRGGNKRLFDTTGFLVLTVERKHRRKRNHGSRIVMLANRRLRQRGAT